MKTYIFITAWVVIIAVAVFLGLSGIEVAQTQYQSQTQNQVQIQENTQLTYVDLNKKSTNVYWKIEWFKDSDSQEKLEDFINNQLTYLQQKELNFGYVQGAFYILYPIYDKEIIAYTNNNVNYNSNVNKVKFNLFDRNK